MRETSKRTVNYTMWEDHPEYGCDYHTGTLILEDNECIGNFNEACDYILNLHDKYHIMFEHEVIISDGHEYGAWKFHFKEVAHDYETGKSTWEQTKSQYMEYSKE